MATIRNKILSGQTLYDLARIDLNETSSHNLRLLSENNGYGCFDEISCNCAECAALSDCIINNQLEDGIMNKFSDFQDPITLNVIQEYNRNQYEGRIGLCNIKRYSYIAKLLNDTETNYIKEMCDCIL